MSVTKKGMCGYAMLGLREGRHAECGLSCASSAHLVGESAAECECRLRFAIR